MRTVATLALLAVVVPTVLPAQNNPEFRIYGELQATGPGSYQLAVANLPVQSTQVNLAELADEDLEMTVIDVGSPGAPVLQVLSATPTEDWVRLQGDTEIGGEARFRVDSDFAQTYYFVISFTSGFVPIDPVLPGLASGTFLCNLNAYALLAAGSFRSHYVEPLAIPNDPLLVGAPIWVQGAIRGATNPFIYLNILHFTITND
ncbi:MAG: hypothetical protein VYE77_10450 [Planctomycetota bacterium]|nr:hypothetical protein [Planctomycetota bacterium]